MTSDVRTHLSFENFHLDCVSGELRRNDREIRLQPQPAKLLVLLATRKGEIVTRAEIQKALWGDDTFVDFEHGINFCIRQIRDALGDSAEKPRYLETVPRVGYRFIALAETRPRERERERSPYPGLNSFSPGDSAFFFGREEELGTVLRKLESRRMLALIGPSGAGKSSFLRAGVLPSLSESVRVVLITPGTAPVRGLARALVSEISGDTEAMRELMEDVVAAAARWRKRSDSALVIVDAFEELFTLNPPEVQAEFATLLGRLTKEAEVPVLLSMRDDFLIRCHDYEELSPVFTDLTPLGPLKGAALRRALVEPALACEYRFETEELVEEMLAEMEWERGALPLLAFAALRLWEKRDREKRLLTRVAYEEIGGVGGALAQHAEETLERIGPQRTPLVRELFRSLVTAEGTRASRKVEELLSISSKERQATEVVLRELIAARLLTSYESSVEIIHESLLSAWPRLERWRNEDEGGALLRDQLRQAAALWQERFRPADLLWTGTAVRDLVSWRERYPGGLTAAERAFADEAARLAGRKRREKQIAVVVVFTFLLGVLGVVTTLWRRSEVETQRAEASKLLALAQLELLTDPTAALAYALKSLELADSREGRLFALQVLQSGPVAIVAPSRFLEEGGSESSFPVFSPSGEWLALGGRRVQARPQDGREPLVFGNYPPPEGGFRNDPRIRFEPDGDVLVANQNGDVRAFAFPVGAELWRAQHERGPTSLFMSGGGFYTVTTEGTEDAVRWWSLDGKESRLVGTMEAIGPAEGIRSKIGIDPGGGTLAYARGRKIYLRSLQRWATPERLLAEHAADVVGVAFNTNGKELAASDRSGEIRIWPTTGDTARPIRTFRGETASRFAWDPSGRWLAAWFTAPSGHKPVRLWDLAAPPGTEPLVLRRGPDTWYWIGSAFHPSGFWLATGHFKDAAFWPLGESYARVLTGHEGSVYVVRFALDGRSLVSSSEDGTTREWPLVSGGDEPNQRFGEYREPGWIVNDVPGGLEVEPFAGGPVRRLTGFSESARIFAAAVSPDGRRLAAAPDYGPKGDKVVRVWDLETDKVQVLGPLPGAGDGPAGATISVRFLDPDRLLAGMRPAGLVLFDLRDSTAKILASKPVDSIAGVSRRQDFGMGVEITSRSPRRGELVRFALEGQAPKVLASHGGSVQCAALDPTDTWVATGSFDGIVRIGSAAGDEPYYFFGHEGTINDVAFSPDGKWLASGGKDKTVRLWPVPDGSKPPFHTLPYEELLDRIRGLTNLRVVADDASDTGYRVEAGTFPGWAKLPEW
jgi:WD40 repeat protein/DNA-binding winged helix-turn-helix (wHTH) protein